MIILAYSLLLIFAPLICIFGGYWLRKCPDKTDMRLKLTLSKAKLGLTMGLAAVVTLSVYAVLGTISGIITKSDINAVDPINQAFVELGYQGAEPVNLEKLLVEYLNEDFDGQGGSKSDDSLAHRWAVQFLGLQSLSQLTPEHKAALYNLVKNHKTHQAPISLLRKYLDLEKFEIEIFENCFDDLDEKPESVLLQISSASSKLGEGSTLIQKVSALFDDKPGRRPITVAYIGRIQSEVKEKRRPLTMIFGGIQAATILLFYWGLTMLSTRYFRLQIIEKNTKVEETKKEVKEELTTDESLGFRGASQEVFDDLKARIENYNYNYIKFCTGAIPSVGFIGTVWGISKALGEADGVVKAMDMASRGQAVEAVTSRLGVAFDTTLVALVCSILLLFASYFVLRCEHQKIAGWENKST